jgi:uncharacterized protein (DUF2342 family)
VVADVGVDGFRRVYDSPAHLPSALELAEPRAWLARVR